VGLNCDGVTGEYSGRRGGDQQGRTGCQLPVSAFVTAIFLMLLILLIQFNSWYQGHAGDVAIVFPRPACSVTDNSQPFGIVMVVWASIGLSHVGEQPTRLTNTYNQNPCARCLSLEQRMNRLLRLRAVLLHIHHPRLLGLMPIFVSALCQFAEAMLGLRTRLYPNW